MYLAPRNVVGSIKGIEVVEMPRNGTKGMCCGAGGARMWMEESIGTKVNDERAAEAISTGATRVATACPFCYIMLDDGVKAAGVEEDQVKVADISIHLLDAIEAGEARAAVLDAPLCRDGLTGTADLVTDVLDIENVGDQIARRTRRSGGRGDGVAGRLRAATGRLDGDGVDGVGRLDQALHHGRHVPVGVRGERAHARGHPVTDRPELEHLIAGQAGRRCRRRRSPTRPRSRSG